LRTVNGETGSFGSRRPPKKGEGETTLSLFRTQTQPLTTRTSDFFQGKRRRGLDIEKEDSAKARERLLDSGGPKKIVGLVIKKLEGKKKRVRGFQETKGGERGTGAQSFGDDFPLREAKKKSERGRGSRHNGPQKTGSAKGDNQ